MLRRSRCFTTVASPISFAYNGRRRRRRLKLPCLPGCFMCRLNTGQDAVRFSTASRRCRHPSTRLAEQFCAAFCRLNCGLQTVRVSLSHSITSCRCAVVHHFHILVPFFIFIYLLSVSEVVHLFNVTLDKGCEVAVDVKSTSISIIYWLTCIFMDISVSIDAYRVLLYIHCVQKKETKTFFCNIFYKTRAIPMKFGTLFLE